MRWPPSLAAPGAPGLMVWWSTALAVLTAALMGTAGAFAQGQCPPAIERATRLLVATTPTPDAGSGTIAFYERPSSGGPWRRSGPDVRMVTGTKGLAWGWTAGGLSRSGERRKREGDKRTPAGVFDLGAPFGLSRASDLPDYLVLRKGVTFCVDDPRSPHYGRIVSRAEAGPGTSGEDMADYKQLYRLGIIVDYPPNAAKRAGSCIFIHVWRRPGRGTAGCLAASEPAVARMQRFTAGHRSAIAILPETARDRLRGCLPE